MTALGIILLVFGLYCWMEEAYAMAFLFLLIGGILLRRAGRKRAVRKAVQKELRNMPQPQPLRAEPGRAYAIEGDRERVFCRDWVVLDVETTGLDPMKDRVVEIAARKFIDGEPSDIFYSLIDPGINVPRSTTQLTGIRTSDVRGEPKFSAIAEELIAFLGDLPMVAHNAKFDAGFIVTEFARAGITFDLSYIDTVRMARWTYPGLENYKLATLIQVFHLIDHKQEHRALSDVDATAKLYQLCRSEQAYRMGRAR